MASGTGRPSPLCTGLCTMLRAAFRLASSRRASPISVLRACRAVQFSSSTTHPSPTLPAKQIGDLKDVGLQHIEELKQGFVQSMERWVWECR
jgi:hypothetical protein